MDHTVWGVLQERVYREKIHGDKKHYAVAYFTPLNGISSARKVTKYPAFVCLFV